MAGLRTGFRPGGPPRYVEGPRPVEQYTPGSGAESAAMLRDRAQTPAVDEYGYPLYSDAAKQARLSRLLNVRADDPSPLTDVLFGIGSGSESSPDPGVGPQGIEGAAVAGVTRGPKVLPYTGSMMRRYIRGLKLGGGHFYDEFPEYLAGAIDAPAVKSPETTRAANVIAALSPRRHASPYLAETEEQIAANPPIYDTENNLEKFYQVWNRYRQGGIKDVEKGIGPGKPVGMMGDTAENVLNALRDEPIAGPNYLKTPSFGGNLAGTSDYPTLDFAMKHIFYPPRLGHYGTGGFSLAEYRATADVLIPFAQRMGLDTKVMQSIMWSAQQELLHGTPYALAAGKPFKDSLAQVWAHHGEQLKKFGAKAPWIAGVMALAALKAPSVLGEEDAGADTASGAVFP